jgi:hypothetical protein
MNLPGPLVLPGVGQRSSPPVGKFRFTERGAINVKGMGTQTTFFPLGRE